MGKSLKYVKDFDFKAKPCKYATGGQVEKPSGMSSKEYSGLKKEAYDYASDLAKSTKTRQGPPMAKPLPPAGPNIPELQRPQMPPQRPAMPMPPQRPAMPMQRPPVGAAPVGARPPGLKKGGSVKAKAAKVSKVMGEFKSGKLHSGSKKGPAVTSRKQAVAIALSESRKGKK